MAAETFLGVGLGPIQTGIFLSGAFKGGIERLVVAEVDPALVEAVRAVGAIRINVAGSDHIREELIDRVEIYNPNDPKDLRTLIEVAAEAGEIATALPGVNFFKFIAPWLKEGFDRQPDRLRFLYAAENDNYAAEKLRKEIGTDYSRTYYLNTVIGKMSKACEIVDNPEFRLVPLVRGRERAHLVEEFNQIWISSVPEIEQRRILNLFVKSDLLPFEEAKLYGHNAIHFMLGWKGMRAGLAKMPELSGHPELLKYARAAFLDECGQALCRKWCGVDPLFTPEGFTAYADELLTRMVNPFLGDRIDRIIRDLPRKFDCRDRVLGTIQLCLEQKVVPAKFMELAVDCMHEIHTA